MPVSQENLPGGHHGRRRPVATIRPQSVGGVSQDFPIFWTAFQRH